MCEAVMQILSSPSNHRGSKFQLRSLTASLNNLLGLARMILTIGQLLELKKKQKKRDTDMKIFRQ